MGAERHQKKVPLNIADLESLDELEVREGVPAAGGLCAGRVALKLPRVCGGP